MTLYPVPLDQRHAQTLQNMQTAIKTLQARTMGIDSGIPLMSLPGQIDPGYPADGSNPMVYVNGSAELTGPYEYLASYFPVAGDTVTMLPVQQSYIVLGAGGPAVNTKLPGNLEVDGVAVMEKTLTVIGTTTTDGPVTANAGCNVTNGLAADDAAVSNQLTVAGNAFLDADAVVGHDAIVGGAAAVTGQLSVTDASFLNGGAKVTGQLEVTDHAFADNSLNIGTCITFNVLASSTGIPANSLIVSSSAPSKLYFIDSAGGVHQLSSPP